MPKKEHIALVIGNSEYNPGYLANPVRDAALVTERLLALRYELFGGASSERSRTGREEGQNLGQKAILDLFQRLIARITPGATVVIYFAGHALQVGARNYLMPLDASLGGDMPLAGLVDIRQQIGAVTRAAGPEGRVVVLLDACRDNPLTDNEMRDIAALVRSAASATPLTERGAHAVARDGLASLKIPADHEHARTFIGFATAPGDVAFDGKRGSLNSPFAEAIDRHLKVRGLEIEELYDRVSKDVRTQVHTELNRYQDPWSESNLSTRLFLHPSSGWPVFWMAVAGLTVGFVISYLVFDKGEIVRAVPWWMWGLGGLFSIVVAGGTLMWGSRDPIDAIFAFAGPAVGFALALAILQIIPDAAAGRPAKGHGLDPEMARAVYLGVTTFGGLLFYIGTALTWLRSPPGWPRTPLQVVDRALSLLLPAIVVGVLWRMQTYMANTDPRLTAVAMFAVLSGIVYATSIALAMRAQRGLFGQFGPFTGAISVGLLMAAFFAIYMAIIGVDAGVTSTVMSNEVANRWLVGLGTVWHGLLGAQLGYCFAYYTPDYKPWAARS